MSITEVLRHQQWLGANGFEWNPIADVWVRQADRIVLRCAGGGWAVGVVGSEPVGRHPTPDAALAALVAP